MAGKKSTCNAWDLSLITGLGRSPGERKGYPLPYSELENSMDCINHGVTKSQTLLSDFHFHIYMCAYIYLYLICLIYTYICIYVHIYVSLYIYVCVCKYIYIYSGSIYVVSISWLLWLMLHWTWKGRYVFKVLFVFLWLYIHKWESRSYDSSRF